MDFNHYCKKCGHHIEFQYGENTDYCPICDKNVERKDTIKGYTRDARVAQLKAMHQLMMEANDEDIYMAWIYLMPDCPRNEDFIDIAMDDEQYNECFDLFIKLIAKKGNRWQEV